MDKLINKPINSFLDINIPVMIDQKFLIIIKAIDKLKEIPVIILSTSFNPIAISETINFGAFDFIIKPDRFDKLVTLLKNILS